MMSNRARWRLGTLLLAGSLAVAACSSGDDVGNPSDTRATSDVSGAGSDIDPNGIVRIAYDTTQSGQPIDVDPLTAPQGVQNNDGLWSLVHGRLLRPVVDANDDGTFSLTGGTEPDLAESAEIIDPGTIAIELKDGLTFSDGSLLDAAAVKASFDATIGAKATNEAGYTPLFFMLERVDATGPTSLTLSFSDGSAPGWYDQYIDSYGTSIIKLKADGSWDPTVTSGPFTISDQVPGGDWTLEKNPEYWNAAGILPAGMEIIATSVSQPQVALAAVQSGQIDVAFTDPTLFSSLSGNLEPLVRVSPDVSVMLHICKSEGPLADRRVRLAINKAIDREAISESIYSGTAQPMHENWPAGHRLNNPDVENVLAYDPDGARQLLEEAGYGAGLTIDIYPIQAFNLPEVAEVMQSQLAEVGISLEIVPTTDYVNQYMNPPKPALGVYPNTAPGPQKLGPWVGDTLANVCHYDDPELNELAEQIGQVSQSSDEAVDLWHQIDEIVANDALGGFIVFRSDLAAYDGDRLGNVTAAPLRELPHPRPDDHVREGRLMPVALTLA